jgi:hypothetical protein
VADLVAALTSPDLLARQVVEPELRLPTDPHFWERLTELVAIGSWHAHPVGLAVGDQRERVLLRRRLGDLLLPRSVAAVEDAKRRAFLVGAAEGPPDVRVLALALLGRRADRSVVEQVVGAIGADDLAGKEQAGETLGRLGGAVAAEALVRAFRSEHAFLAATITRALVCLGADALPGLTGALADPDDGVRWNAAEALAAIGDASALPASLGALEDPDVAVRWHAARGLARLGDPAIVALLQVLEVWPLSPWLARGAAYVLRYAIRGTRPRAVQKVEEALRHATAGVEVPVRAAAAIPGE